MPQTRRMSLLEVFLNVFSGFIVSYLVWVFVMPTLFGISTTPGKGLQVTCVFTVVSVIRGYAWRRIFNAQSE